MSTKNVPFKSRLNGDRISPLPLTIEGTLAIKKGQSLPNSADKVSNVSLDKFKENNSFNHLSTNAASDEPPPSPAPEGICFRR